MSLRGTRTLSRLFQATMRMIPEKRYSGDVRDTNPSLPERDLVFEPDFSSSGHEGIWHYHTKLVFKDGEFLDMDLVDRKRRLLYAGKLFRQSDSAFERRGQLEFFVLLFDNYLVITKPVGEGPNLKLHVYKRSIPLDLLKLEPYGDTSTRARRGSSTFLGRDNATISYLSKLGGRTITDDSRGKFPFTIIHEGRLDDSHTLYADTEETRSMWRSKLEEAIQLRQQSSQIFKMKMLNRESFLMKTGISSGYLPKNRQLTRTINCITPFTTRDGRSLMAIGCVEGLWIGNIQDPQSFHRILPLQMIRQCTVLEDFGIILILAHNDLCAYDLESCVPTYTGSRTYHPPQKLNSEGEVSFFRVGMVDGEARVVFSKRKGTDMIFRILKIVRSIGQASVSTESSNANPGWFRVYRDFFLPFNCTDIIFLRRNLVILHRNGFSMFSPLDFQCVEMPVPAERNVEHKNLIKRCRSSQSLGMFRLQTETFLLCYDKFGVYVDKHGTLINDRIAIEWEGVVGRASYHHPYILLFSRSFVEIRHAASGQLKQIIRGNAIRCLWEGNDYRGKDPTTAQPNQNLSIIGVTNAPAGLDELATQCIFTLVPPKHSLSPVETRPSLSTAERANTRL
ncbi:hypothetical protein BDM02DRAFT_3008877 [Thelephora ganbajun]|uniref:Uncharacterized protein n=1 Tax=Thelephora ganbajun TaxID=370292 RepID=A0ACB6ZAH9_THEGA|nr:hypothetical protein BDM02DRAFT_3008877 [Thelephora ganbajun]